MAARGQPKTGGRQKGTPNKVTADVRALAQDYGKEAIEKLAKLMADGESEQVQLAAARELLDRGYGKPTQVLGSDPEVPLLDRNFKVEFISAEDAYKAMLNGPATT